MKYMILTELCVPSSDKCPSGCGIYNPEKSEILIAENFQNAKNILSEKIAFAFAKKVKGVFDRQNKFIPIYDLIDGDCEDDECDSCNKTLFEIEKLLQKAKAGEIDKYTYCGKCKCSYDNGCTLVKYSPSKAVFYWDYENGITYFSLNVHNMKDENKTYYFEYCDWREDTSFRVTLYPINA